MPPEVLQQLIEKYLAGKATKEEKERLQQWYMQNAEGGVQVEVDALHENENEELLEAALYKRIQKEIGKEKTPVRRMTWVRWAAAACIILVTGYVLWVTGSGKASKQQGSEAVAVIKDVAAPVNARAVITLANGSKVYLDSAGNGILAQENNVNVVRSADGIISYELNRTSASLSAGSDAKTKGAVAHNTLFNPRGSKVISLTLSDGTRVWLNSESSLRYPASFAPSAVSREVEITGEAYFEVKHNAKQPFKVHLPKGGIVEDLGTSFNINCYSDESDIKTTLIEGSVRIFANSASSAVKLKPGEQAIVKPGSLNHPITTSPDIEQVMAWKNGRFQFGDGTDIKQIMKQLERWYDVSVQYKGDVNGEIGGGISRNVNVSQVLNMLQMTGSVKFDVQGKQIIVSQ